MRKVLILAAALGLVFAAGQASSKDFKINKQQVKNACGDNLQGGGKNFGCTKCDGGLCRDYSCNGSGKGRQGCWETVIKRTGRQPGKDHGRPLRATTSDHGKMTTHASPTGSGQAGHHGMSGSRATAPMQKNPPMATRSNGGGGGSSDSGGGNSQHRR
jgi:hypothetical protein